LASFSTTEVVPCYKAPKPGNAAALGLIMLYASEGAEKMKIAFLGLGKMGSHMARRLVEAGHEVTVWNRSAAATKPLAALGAVTATSAAEAARSCDAVLTMLFDDAAHEAVLLGEGGVLDALRPGSVHVSLSTISVALSERLTAEHARRGQPFVAAPVFGRPSVAADGRLWIVVAGAEDVIARVRPLLEALSRGISVIGPEPRQAHALKLGGNFMISAMIHALGEAFVYAEGQGIAAQTFLETVNSALFQSPFYAAYGNVMLNPPPQPGATIELGAKDLRLLREAASARHTGLSLADNLAEVFAQARQAGLENEDWAVGQYRMAQMRGKLT
jgi:3-hydroxyisobutyrate dehydrogenase-like beta-hydroxyacid dehydrogenase